MPTKLVWATPDGDKLLAYMARVSNPAGQDSHETAPRLIRYLLRNKHWSPFEMVNMCVEVETTRDIGRQLLRHRSLTFQEFSQRYQDVGVLDDVPPRDARLQHPTNRQASLPCDDPELVAWWTCAQARVQGYAGEVYRDALSRGIAKEVARAVLPEGLTPTRLYANGTIRSWLHFVEARIHPGAQAEIVEIARDVRELIFINFPHTCEAWEGL